MAWCGEFPVDLRFAMAGSHEMQVLNGDQVTYPRSATPPALCISSGGASLDLVPWVEASHAVHLPRRIDLRPSVTARVVGPKLCS